MDSLQKISSKTHVYLRFIISLFLKRKKALINIVWLLQEFMHHVGLYMAKERGAKIASQVLFDAVEKP